MCSLDCALSQTHKITPYPKPDKCILHSAFFTPNPKVILTFLYHVVSALQVSQPSICCIHICVFHSCVLHVSTGKQINLDLITLTSDKQQPPTIMKCSLLHFISPVISSHRGTNIVRDVMRTTVKNKEAAIKNTLFLFINLTKEHYLLIHINPLNTKRGPLYLKSHFEPRRKHFSSRL